MQFRFNKDQRTYRKVVLAGFTKKELLVLTPAITVGILAGVCLAPVIGQSQAINLAAFAIVPFVGSVFFKYHDMNLFEYLKRKSLPKKQSYLYVSTERVEIYMPVQVNEEIKERADKKGKGKE